jgi:hypothetical protein
MIHMPDNVYNAESRLENGHKDLSLQISETHEAGYHLKLDRNCCIRNFDSDTRIKTWRAIGKSKWSYLA